MTVCNIADVTFETDLCHEQTQEGDAVKIGNQSDNNNKNNKEKPILESTHLSKTFRTE